MIKRVLTYLLCVCSLHVVAQDIHFSNFYSNTLNITPADAGFFNGRHRFCIAYRDQYRTVAQPYQTFSASYDRKFTKRTMQTMLGYGLLLNFDIAGDANYNTTQVGVPIAQHIPFGNKQFIFSYGILPAIYYNSIDYSNLTWSEQFNGIQYNPDIEITEDFDLNSAIYFDISAGTQLTYKPTKNQNYTIGVAWYNINQPKISFFDDDDVTLRHRFLVHGSAIISATSTFDIVPGVKMQFQGKQHEFHFGCMGIMYFEQATISQAQFGVWFRSKNKDAVIFGLGGRYKGFDIMLDYDLNISTLRTASNLHGAIEVTASYIIEDKNRSKRMTAIHCPHTL